MLKFDDSAGYLFIVGQIVFFGLLVALVIFIAISDKRATKRLDKEERQKAERDAENKDHRS